MPDLSAERFRQVMAHVPTSVAVVAAVVETGATGLSVGTFVPVSLEPPLVGFFVANTSKSWPAINASGSFCVSVLGHDQADLSSRFALSEADKFEGVEWRPAPSGNPLLRGAVAFRRLQDRTCRRDRGPLPRARQGARHGRGDRTAAIGASPQQLRPRRREHRLGRRALTQSALGLTGASLSSTINVDMMNERLIQVLLLT